jgi:hypothetical protein
VTADETNGRDPNQNPNPRREKKKKRRHACLLLAFAWAIGLAAILAVMKVCMVGFMWVGIDFTAGMAHQRGAKKKWRARRNLSVGGDLDALNDGRATGAGKQNRFVFQDVRVAAVPGARPQAPRRSQRRRDRGRRRGRVRAEEGWLDHGARHGEKTRHAVVSLHREPPP